MALHTQANHFESIGVFKINLLLCLHELNIVGSETEKVKN